MIYVIQYRDDGAIEVLYETDGDCQFEWIERKLFIQEEDAKKIRSGMDAFIIDGQAIRQRTDMEMEQRVKEMHNRVKSGELHRVPNDLIDKYKHFFTLEELEEVELPEQKIRRLETRLKALEARLASGISQ